LKQKREKLEDTRIGDGKEIKSFVVAKLKRNKWTSALKVLDLILLQRLEICYIIKKSGPSEYYCIITYISKLNEPEHIQIEWFGDPSSPYKVEPLSFYDGSRFIKIG